MVFPSARGQIHTSTPADLNNSNNSTRIVIIIVIIMIVIANDSSNDNTNNNSKKSKNSGTCLTLSWDPTLNFNNLVVIRSVSTFPSDKMKHTGDTYWVRCSLTNYRNPTAE